MPQAQKKVISIVKKASKSKKVIALPKAEHVSVKEMLGQVNILLTTYKQIGNERKLATSNIKVEADPRWIGVTKKLVDSDTVNEILAVGYRTKTFIKRHSLPCLLKDGAHLIPKVYVDEVNARLNADNEEIQKLVKRLMGEYEDIIGEAKTRLGKFFNEADYPSKKGLASAFGITWNYVSFDVPVSLDQVNHEIYIQEQQKAEKQWGEAGEVWQQLLREEFQKLVSHLVERLKPAKDGKKKVLRDSPFTNITEWAQTFDPRNIQNDTQLKALVEKTKALLNGANPESLRDDEKARDNMRASFETIKNTLGNLIELAPSREVSFED